MEDLAAAYRLLGDETRLRVLRLLAREELGPSELATILGRGAPAVSRQLALLRDGGLIDERREGRFAFFTLSPAVAEGSVFAPALGHLADAEDPHGDLARLADVLRARHERGGDEGRPTFVPGRSWRAWARALCHLIPAGLRVADIGCGGGALTLEIARFAGSVVAIDPEAEPLTRARAEASRQEVRGVLFTRASLERLPLDDGSVDLAVLSQTLHSVTDPAAALTEALRVLAPGGRLLVLDLQPHKEAWVFDQLGHVHAGFTPRTLARLIEDTGFASVVTEPMPGRARDPFRVVLASAARPSEQSKPGSKTSKRTRKRP